MTRRSPLRTATALAAVAALLVAACGDDDDGGEAAPTTATAPTTVGASPEPTTGGEGGAGGGAISEERCAANREAGTLTYISSFDFAAAAGIVDVVVADAEGYFDEVCLDVELQSGVAPQTAQQVASGLGEFGSAGSYGEVVNVNLQGELSGDDQLVAIANYGKTAVEALVLPADSPVQEPADLAGTRMGVKGDIPYSIQTMLYQAGVTREDLQIQQLDGFDPVAHLALGIDSLPVYKSNEPNTLEQNGIEFRTLDPLDYDVPSSFGILITTRGFLEEHPTAVEDFVRASFRGMQFALENPDEAVAHCFALIEAAGNQFFLAQEAERYRAGTELDLAVETTPEGTGLGVIDPEGYQAEVDALVEAGVFEAPEDPDAFIAPEVSAGLYEGTELIWPAP